LRDNFAASKIQRATRADGHATRGHDNLLILTQILLHLCGGDERMGDLMDVQILSARKGTKGEARRLLAASVIPLAIRECTVAAEIAAEVAARTCGSDGAVGHPAERIEPRAHTVLSPYLVHLPD